MQAAIDTKNDAAGKYILLGMAKDLAAGAGDAETAFAAIAELETYQIDSLNLKFDTLTVISKSVRGQDAKGLIDRINPLIDEAIGADRYDLAGQLAQLGVSVAKTTKELDAIKAATGRVQEARNAETAYQQVKKALASLADKPKDPEANLAAGRFYCLTKGQWDKGLPMLALGSDAALKALAEKELAKPTDSDKQVELGDGWWALAEKDNGAARGRLRERAGYWYEQVLPNLTGLMKAKVEKRLSEIGTRNNGSSNPKELVLDLGNKVTLKLVLIPAGKFLMGSPKDEKGRDVNEGPQHEVNISKPFYMGIYAVTQEQYQQVMGKNPSQFKGVSNPVETVSWEDAVEFCKALSKKSGKTVRLPTEAEWEFAC